MTSWSAVTTEAMAWISSPARELSPGLAACFGGPRKYSAAVPAFIADAVVDLPAEVVAASEEAARELSRFDAELGDRVADFGPVLLRSEAAAELAGEISPDLLRHLHAVLMADQPRHAPGEWRREPVWIGSSAQSPTDAEYVAPRWERVPELIDDLAAFAKRLDVAPLALTAIAHAQFETIHPFTDGNGRTGRALAQTLLRYRSVTRNVAIPVSAGLLADVTSYHRALETYRSGDPAPIVERFTDASVRAVANARRLVADIERIRAGWQGRVRARRDSGVWRVLDLVARTPVVDARLVANELGIRAQNTYPLLRELTEQGVLRSKAEYRLGTLWRSDEILAAVDRFTARAGRRDQP